jgi:hypothetical protein
MARSTLTRKIFALATLGALTLGSYKLGTTVLDMFADDSIEAKRLANQVWIERLPTDDRDMIHHLVMIEDGGDRFGAFGKSSQWRHFVELFRWAREENRLTILLPQERKRLDLGVKVWNCEGEAPAPFQLCLELSNKRKTMKYYSRHDWSIDAANPDALADLVAATPQLAGALELPTAPATFDAAEFAAAEDFAEDVAVAE